MKSRAAVLFESPGRYEVVDVDIDEPKANEVLVRYTASGLCGSDVHFSNGSSAGPVPFCAGHEGAGIVQEVGPGVTAVRPGDHFVASFVPSCGRCRYCASGREQPVPTRGVSADRADDGRHLPHALRGAGPAPVLDDQHLCAVRGRPGGVAGEDPRRCSPRDRVPARLRCGYGTGFVGLRRRRSARGTTS